MKLSFKFFCIAYLTTLLSISLVGVLLLQSTIDEMWTSQIERIHTSQTYAMNTFLSYANYYSSEIPQTQLDTISKQIKNTTAQEILSLSITSVDSTNLEKNRGKDTFSNNNQQFIMTSSCHVVSNQYVYLITTTSDFSNLIALQNHIWKNYRLITMLVALLSGLILYTLTTKVAQPLNHLSKTAKLIAKGEYGKTVHIKTSDIEVKQLASNFNTMSIATKQAMDTILLEADKKNQFVANFSHEMKTPLTTIIGYTSLLKDYALTKNEQKDALDAIFHEAKRLDHLSLAMLELFVTQNQEVELTPTSLKEIQLHLIRICDQLSNKYDINYELLLPDTFVFAQKDLLLSLFYNLIDNAFKASNKGTSIQIKGTVIHKKILITIQDHGRGISQEHIQRLTEPFYRVDKSRSRIQGGAGLGLSICKEIASIHQTQLAINSKLNIGTSITFELRQVGDLCEQ